MVAKATSRWDGVNGDAKDGCDRTGGGEQDASGNDDSKHR